MTPPTGDVCYVFTGCVRITLISNIILRHPVLHCFMDESDI